MVRREEAQEIVVQAAGQDVLSSEDSWFSPHSQQCQSARGQDTQLAAAPESLSEYKGGKSSRFHIYNKNKFSGFNILLQHIFLTLPGCSLLSKDEAEQEAFTCAGSRVVLLQVFLITVSLLVCSLSPSCPQAVLSIHSQRWF